MVSTHGGRQEETLLSTIEVLPEIVDVVKGRIPVLIDGGFRRGTDVFKALAIGATAIGIGRPCIWVKQCPIERPIMKHGAIVEIAELGGLHHRYERIAV